MDYWSEALTRVSSEDSYRSFVERVDKEMEEIWQSAEELDKTSIKKLTNKINSHSSDKTTN